MAAALTATGPSPAPLLAAGTTTISSSDGLVPVQIVDHPVNAVVNESASAIFNCGFQSLANETAAVAFVLKWRKDGKVIRKWDNGLAELDGDSSGATESSMFRDDGEDCFFFCGNGFGGGLEF